MIRTSTAIRLGVHPRMLYALRDTGELEQVDRGLYRLASVPQLTSQDVLPIAMRVPRAVICLISALAQHGLTTQVPHAVDIALPRHSQIPKIDGIPVRVLWYSESSFSSGISAVSIDGVVPVRIYSPEKTIADRFKYRNEIAIDVAIEGLRTYRERKRKPDFKAVFRFRENQSGGTSHARVPGLPPLNGRDIGASVRQRLLNQARAKARPFQELLQYFAMERAPIEKHHDQE
jgi:hypothetical protein